MHPASTVFAVVMHLPRASRQLGRVDSFDPEPCCCDRQLEGGSGGFFGGPGEIFEPLTHSSTRCPYTLFDHIQSVSCDWTAADNGLDASVHQIVANFVAVVALVAEEFVRIYIVKFHQRIIAFDLVHLAAGDIESQRVAFGVRAEVDFGREAAARAAERFLILIPPFTPAACCAPARSWSLWHALCRRPAQGSPVSRKPRPRHRACSSA